MSSLVDQYIGKENNFIENEGIPVPFSRILNFTGAGVNASKIGKKTNVDVPGGGGGGGGSSNVIIFSPSEVSSGNKYQTWVEVISAINSATYPVDLYIHKPFTPFNLINQTIALPTGTYNLSKCRLIEPTPESFIVILECGNGVYFSEFASSIKDIIITNTKTETTPTWEISGLRALRMRGSAFLNFPVANSPSIRVAALGQLFIQSDNDELKLEIPSLFITGSTKAPADILGELHLTLRSQTIFGDSAYLFSGSGYLNVTCLDYDLTPVSPDISFSIVHPAFTGNVNINDWTQFKIGGQNTAFYRVYLCATSNINLASITSSSFVIDGQQISSLPFLLTNQTTATENGIYRFEDEGIAQVIRFEDGVHSELDKALILVEKGADNAGKLFQLIFGLPVLFIEKTLITEKESVNTFSNSVNSSNETLIQNLTSHGTKYSEESIELTLDTAAAVLTEVEISLPEKVNNFVNIFDAIGNVTVQQQPLGSIFLGAISAVTGSNRIKISFTALAAETYRIKVNVRYKI